MEKKNIGDPIYYFTKMDYEVFRNPVLVQEPEVAGEVDLEAHYGCLNIKNGKEMKGIAYHNPPYYPANIPAVGDAVNIVKNDNGEFEIDPEVSYIECVNALAELVHEGVPMKMITTADIKNRIQEYAKAI